SVPPRPGASRFVLSHRPPHRTMSWSSNSQCFVGRSIATLGLFVGMLAQVGCSNPPQEGWSVPPKQHYEFVENTERWVEVIQGDFLLVGKLDKNGDFVQEIKRDRRGGSSRGPSGMLIND